jgi:hypothetical protein
MQDLTPNPDFSARGPSRRFVSPPNDLLALIQEGPRLTAPPGIDIDEGPANAATRGHPTVLAEEPVRPLAEYGRETTRHRLALVSET